MEFIYLVMVVVVVVAAFLFAQRVHRSFKKKLGPWAYLPSTLAFFLCSLFLYVGVIIASMMIFGFHR